MAPPSRREAIGCSLWLVPEGETRDALAAVIESLARAKGGPSFEPHVTLLGGLASPEAEVVQEAERLAAGLEPFVIRLGPAGHQDAFFRCLFLHAHKDAALAGAHARALEIFAIREARVFMPHLSLLYADLPAQTRAALVAELGDALACSFEVATLEVHRTDGAADAWQLLAAFRLCGAQGEP
jgi:2'-5' RNA ligase